MANEETEQILVHATCRIEHAHGLAAIDAAQKLAKSGVCPMIGEIYQYTLHAKHGTQKAREEIALHLPKYEVCGLMAGESDFWYATSSLDEGDNGLPHLE